MPQVSRPEADAFYPISGIENWQNERGEQDQALFESINTFLPNDLTFVESELFESPDLPITSLVYVTKLSTVPNPETATATGLAVRLRLGKDEADGQIVNAVVELREGWKNESSSRGNLVGTKRFENITAVATEYSFVVTPTNAAKIQDFSELYLRIFFEVSLT